MQHSQIDQITKRYYTLRNYCDQFFASVAARGGAAGCRMGCSECCTLSSACLLEGFIIGNNICKDRHKTAERGKCAFLSQNTCGIYPHRPIICRTHGLLIREEGVIRETCPLGREASDAPAESMLIFDSEKIAENLMRLNVAFCICLGIQEIAEKRLPFANLLTHEYNAIIRERYSRFLKVQ